MNTAFADDIITGWTAGQASIVWQSLLYQVPQKEIAEKFGTTVQNISKLLTTAKENLIDMYISRYEKLITTIL